MLKLKKKYVVNAQSKIVAVQIDLEAFQQVEKILEGFILIRLLHEAFAEKKFSLQEARVYYSRIKSANKR